MKLLTVCLAAWLGPIALPATAQTVSPLYTQPQARSIALDAAGLGVWTFTHSFSVSPVVTYSVINVDPANIVTCGTTAVSTVSVTVQCFKTNSVTILGISVLALTGSAAGLPLHLFAREPTP